jgi:hypothetical protein
MFAALLLASAHAGVQDEPVPIDYHSHAVSDSTLSVTVANTASAPASAVVSASIGGISLGSELVTVDAGAMSTIAFSINDDADPVGSISIGIFAP